MIQGVAAPRCQGGSPVVSQASVHSQLAKPKETPMADSQLNGTPTPMTEDQARRLISQNLAELLQKGSCTIRVQPPGG